MPRLNYLIWFSIIPTPPKRIRFIKTAIITMQKALLLLESEGLLVTRGTAGRWVTDSEETLGAARLAVKDKAVGAIIRDAREAGIGLDELIEKIKKGWETK